MTRSTGRLVLVAVSAADGAVLATAQPDWSGLAAGLRAPRQWVADVGADAAAAALSGSALWVLALWVALGLTAALATNLPGILGGTARQVADVVLPKAVHRLVVGATGIGIALSPVAAAAHPAPKPATPSPTAAPSTLPSPVLPVSPTVAVGAQPTSASPSPPTSEQLSSTQTQPHPAAGGRLRVSPGDSLWSIAAAHLEPSATATEVGRAWPRWYAANRTVIGPDPNRIYPGEVLRVPSDVDGRQG